MHELYKQSISCFYKSNVGLEYVDIEQGSVFNRDYYNPITGSRTLVSIIDSWFQTQQILICVRKTLNFN